MNEDSVSMPAEADETTKSGSIQQSNPRKKLDYTARMSSVRPSVIPQRFDPSSPSSFRFSTFGQTQPSITEIPRKSLSRQYAEIESGSQICFSASGEETKGKEEKEVDFRFAAEITERRDNEKEKQQQQHQSQEVSMEVDGLDVSQSPKLQQKEPESTITENKSTTTSTTRSNTSSSRQFAEFETESQQSSAKKHKESAEERNRDDSDDDVCMRSPNESLKEEEEEEKGGEEKEEQNLIDEMSRSSIQEEKAEEQQHESIKVEEEIAPQSQHQRPVLKTARKTISTRSSNPLASLSENRSESRLFAEIVSQTKHKTHKKTEKGSSKSQHQQPQAQKQPKIEQEVFQPMNEESVYPSQIGVVDELTVSTQSQKEREEGEKSDATDIDSDEEKKKKKPSQSRIFSGIVIESQNGKAKRRAERKARWNSSSKSNGNLKNVSAMHSSWIQEGGHHYESSDDLSGESDCNSSSDDGNNVGFAVSIRKPVLQISLDDNSQSQQLVISRIEIPLRKQFIGEKQLLELFDSLKETTSEGIEQVKKFVLNPFLKESPLVPVALIRTGSGAADHDSIISNLCADLRSVDCGGCGYSVCKIDSQIDIGEMFKCVCNTLNIPLYKGCSTIDSLKLFLGESRKAERLNLVVVLIGIQKCSNQAELLETFVRLFYEQRKKLQSYLIIDVTTDEPLEILLEQRSISMTFSSKFVLTNNEKAMNRITEGILKQWQDIKSYSIVVGPNVLLFALDNFFEKSASVVDFIRILQSSFRNYAPLFANTTATTTATSEGRNSLSEFACLCLAFQCIENKTAIEYQWLIEHLSNALGKTKFQKPFGTVLWNSICLLTKTELLMRLNKMERIVSEFQSIQKNTRDLIRVLQEIHCHDSEMSMIECVNKMEEEAMRVQTMQKRKSTTWQAKRSSESIQFKILGLFNCIFSQMDRFKANDFNECADNLVAVKSNFGDSMASDVLKEIINSAEQREKTLRSSTKFLFELLKQNTANGKRSALISELQKLFLEQISDGDLFNNALNILCQLGIAVVPPNGQNAFVVFNLISII